MKLITRDTDYAVRSLIFIANKTPDIVSVSELVRKLKIPRPFLRKILQNLGKHKVLNAYKGVGGGFVLAKNPSKIFLLELIKIFQGPLELNKCLFKKQLCPNRSDCILRKKICTIENQVFRKLKSINLKKLLKE